MKGTARLAGLLVVAISVVALTACGGGGGDEVPGTVKATSNFRFDPDSVTVRFDRETILTFKNTDKTRTHNFTLSYVFTDLDNFVNVDAKPGETKEVKFTVKNKPASGFLTYYCTYHQGQGMHGRIKVT
jgi:plastocyanin